MSTASASISAEAQGYIERRFSSGQLFSLAVTIVLDEKYTAQDPIDYEALSGYLHEVGRTAAEKISQLPLQELFGTPHQQQRVLEQLLLAIRQHNAQNDYYICNGRDDMALTITCFDGRQRRISVAQRRAYSAIATVRSAEPRMEWEKIAHNNAATLHIKFLPIKKAPAAQSTAIGQAKPSPTP